MSLPNIHKTLLQDGYEMPPYPQFANDMQNENNLKALHDNLGKDYEMPEYNTFKEDIAKTNPNTPINVEPPNTTPTPVEPPSPQQIEFGKTYDSKKQYTDKKTGKSYVVMDDNKEAEKEGSQCRIYKNADGTYTSQCPLPSDDDSDSGTTPTLNLNIPNLSFTDLIHNIFDKKPVYFKPPPTSNQNQPRHLPMPPGVKSLGKYWYPNATDNYDPNKPTPSTGQQNNLKGGYRYEIEMMDGTKQIMTEPEYKLWLLNHAITSNNTQ